MKPTLDQLYEAAKAHKYGVGRIGRWGISLTLVTPRTRAKHHERVTYYLDGKRVSRKQFMADMEAN